MREKTLQGKAIRAAVACAMMAALSASAATRVYWTNATGDKSIQTAGNWKDEAGNVLTTAPKSGESYGIILVFTNFAGTVTTTLDGYYYYGYMFGEGASVSLGTSRNFYIYGGGVTHEGASGVNVLNYTVNLRAATNVFDVVHPGAEIQIGNTLAGGDTRVLLKRGKGTLLTPASSGSRVENIKEVVM